MIPLEQSANNQHMLVHRVANDDAPVLPMLALADDGPVKALWQRRLAMFVKADNTLLWMNRLRKVSSTLILALALTLAYALFAAPSLSEAAFLSMTGLLVVATGIYPVLFVLSRESQRNRDNVSRMFYENKHEIEVTNDSIAVFNRADYNEVARVALTDCHIGYQAQ